MVISARWIAISGLLLGSTWSGAALAADALAPEANWSGWYTGSLAGYAFGRSEIYNDDAGLEEFDGDSFSHKPEGFMSGLALGYNWQPSASSFVFGLEGDVSGLHLNGSDFEGIEDDGIQTIISGMGTLRGRLGYGSDRLHIYGTGGLALAHVAQFAGDNDCDPSGPVTDDNCDGWDTDDALYNTGDWKLGWTLGAGAEYRAFGNWIVRGEYLYVDLGHYGAVAPDDADDTGDFKNSMHIARVGLIRQLGGPGSSDGNGEADWVGAHAGVVAGYAFGDAALSGDDAANGLGEFDGDSFSHHPNGIIGGLVAGYSIMPFQNSLVLGVESDVSLADIDKTDFETEDDGIQTVISTLSTARARVGFAQDQFQIYATGGLAAGHISQFAGDSDCDPGADTSCNGWDEEDAVFNTGDWKLGWTAGAGAEFRFGSNWRARAEYLYVDLGKYKAKVPDEADEFAKFDNNLHVARVGLILDF